MPQNHSHNTIEQDQQVSGCSICTRNPASNIIVGHEIDGFLNKFHHLLDLVRCRQTWSKTCNAGNVFSNWKKNTSCEITSIIKINSLKSQQIPEIIPWNRRNLRARWLFWSTSPQSCPGESGCHWTPKWPQRWHPSVPKITQHVRHLGM
jgi:hypothetical protein